MAYVVLAGTLVTGLYDPLTIGRDDFWAIALVALAAHLGLGLAIARWWALLLPIAGTLASAVAAEDGYAYLVVFLFIPVLCGATAIGWLLGRILHDHAGKAAVAVFALAALPAAWAGAEQVKRAAAPHVSPALQAQLPTELRLSNLCPAAETPPKLDRELRRSAEVLIRELHRHPGHRVTYTFYDAHGSGAETKDITVRELAEEELSYLDSEIEGEDELQVRLRGPGCKDVRRRLQDALG